VKRLFVLILSVFVFPFLPAQSNKPVIHVMPFAMEGIGTDEARLFESLVQSYLSDIGDVENIEAALQTVSPDTLKAADSPVKAPDFTLTGSVFLEQDSRIFKFDIFNTLTGETKSFTMISKSAGEMALKTRSLLEAAFPLREEPSVRPFPREANPENINENRVMGSWKGEPGIETIRLHRGGRGIAVFSSGAQMALSYSIENNTLKVRQTSPNSERYFYPLPLETAKQAAALAEPMSWELKLYKLGNTLRGSKTAAGFRQGDSGAIEIVPAEVRETEWTKSFR
jgi:hypothetical protein